MTIEQALSNIRSAVYGNEVKQSIIEGLQLCYTERASGGYDPVDDLNQFYSGTSIISENAENRPFDGPFFLIAGGNETICCQLAIDPSGNNSRKLRKKENDVWSAWGSIAISRTLNYWNYDGTQLLYTETVIDGMNGTWTGSPPRQPTPQYNYLFVGWNTSPNQTVAQENATRNVTSDRDVYAAYTTTTQDYTVTFINISSVMATVSVPYGGTAVYPESALTPARTSTSQYDYVFVGWNANSSATEPDENYGTNVYNNRTVYAIYEPVLRSYTVRFYNVSTLLQSVVVPYGSDAEYTSEYPVKQSDAQYDYEFIGWNTDPNADYALYERDLVLGVGENTDVYAIFAPIVQTYVVTFMNGSTTLQSVTVPYGSNVTYSGPTPTKSPSAQYTYSFANGWASYDNASTIDSSILIGITSNRTIYAVFNSAVRYYTVRFINQGTVLQTLSIPYDGTAVFTGTNPTKDPTAQYTYTFAGWNTSPYGETPDVNYGTKIRSDRDVYAVFSPVIRTYTVRFMNGINVLQAVNNVPYGGSATYTEPDPVHPTEPDDWLFAGFDPPGTDITGDTDCQPVWVPATFAKYIRYYNYDGSAIVFTEAVTLGEDGVWNGAPARESSDGQYYTFIGWSTELGSTVADPAAQLNITTNRDLYPVYSSTLLSYTVRFFNGTTVLQASQVEHGSNAVYYGSTPTRSAIPQYTFTFIGWNQNRNATTADPAALNNITGLRDLYAIFSAVLNTYTVRFMNGNTVLQTNLDVPYGSSVVYTESIPVHPTEPSQFTFGGFYPDGSEITSDTDCYPIWINVEETDDTREIVSRTISGSYYNDLVQSIGEYAFRDCAGLESVEFPIVKTIKDSAFLDCASLTSAEFPLVTSIRDNAFYGCESLETLIVGTESERVCELSSNSLDGTDASLTIYVPDELVESYQAAPNWTDYSSQIHGISNLPGD